jgi:hypothetical protein
MEGIKHQAAGIREARSFQLSDPLMPYACYLMPAI